MDEPYEGEPLELEDDYPDVVPLEKESVNEGAIAADDLNFAKIEAEHEAMRARAHDAMDAATRKAHREMDGPGNGRPTEIESVNEGAIAADDLNFAKIEAEHEGMRARAHDAMDAATRDASAKLQWAEKNLGSSPKPADPRDSTGRPPVPEAGEGLGGVFQSNHDFLSAKSDADGALAPDLSAQVEAATFERVESTLNGLPGKAMDDLAR